MKKELVIWAEIIKAQPTPLSLETLDSIILLQQHSSLLFAGVPTPATVSGDLLLPKMLTSHSHPHQKTLM